MKVVEQKRSFWDFLRGVPRPTVVQFYDPLKIKVRSTVKIDQIGVTKDPFLLESIEEYERHINDQSFVFTDYNLVSRPVSGDPKHYKLRVIPISGATAGDGQEYNILLLSRDDQVKYDAGIKGVFTDATDNKIWTIDLSGETDGLKAGETQHLEYYRNNDAEKRYVARVARITTRIEAPTFLPSQISARGAEYLDFSREIEVLGGVKKFEFYFVEKETDVNRRVECVSMYRGLELNENRITVV